MEEFKKYSIYKDYEFLKKSKKKPVFNKKLHKFNSQKFSLIKSNDDLINLRSAAQTAAKALKCKKK